MSRTVVLAGIVMLVAMLLLSPFAAITPTVQAAPDKVTETPEPTQPPTECPPTETPTPTVTPPAWDKSSLTVSGKCVDGQPTFTVKNGDDSGDMTGPAAYWFFGYVGGASDCAADTDGLEPDGFLGPLLAGQSVDIPFPYSNAQPPYRICVQQRPGHQGVGWTNDVIDEDDACVTAIDEVDENAVRPVWFMFLPALSH